MLHGTHHAQLHALDIQLRFQQIETHVVILRQPEGIFRNTDRYVICVYATSFVKYLQLLPTTLSVYLNGAALESS